MRKMFSCAASLWMFQFSFTGASSAGDVAVLRPATSSHDAIPLLHENKVHGKNFPHIASELPNSNGVIDTLTWRNPGASQIVNFGFLNPGDSMLVWLRPATECSLLAIRFRPVNFEGTIILDIWDASNYDKITYSSDSTDENGWWGTFDPIDCGSCWVSGFSDHSPLGWSKTDPEHHFWGPVGVLVTDDNADTWIEIPTTYISRGRIDLGKDPFYIGASFYRTSGWGFYAQYDWTLPYNFFKFYALDEGPGPHDGWFLRKFFTWFEAIVKYHENIPPAISELKVQNYTYDQGPFEITAIIEDRDFACPPMPGVSFADLVFDMNGGVYRVPMEGPRTGGMFSGIVPELTVGDTVTYWIETSDPAGLSSQSNKITFARIEPAHPMADILIIWDYQSDPELDTFFVDLLASLETQYEYELWNNPKRQGLDPSVINWGWHTIYISGWMCQNTLPGSDYDGNPFVEWLEANTSDDPHNLLYIDQGYCCAHPEYDCGFDEELSALDFMYDYFGVAVPLCDGGKIFEWSPDSVAFGRQGTEFEDISVNFLPDVIYPNNPDNRLWPDWLVELTEDAEQIFEYKDSGCGAGVRLDRGHYKTVYLPWQDFFAVDSLENGDLVPRPGLTATIEKILEWFGTKTDVQQAMSEPSLPDQCHLFQNHPNPFNVSTDIRYLIADDTHASPISLKIYNILGQEVKTMVDEVQETGTYSVQWDGKDDFGKDVGSGIYFFQMKIGDFEQTKRMLLLK